MQFRFLIVLPLLVAMQPVESLAQSTPHSTDVIPAVAEPGAIPLYGEATPGRRNSEIWFHWFDANATSVRNVTYPTLTPVLPDPVHANGAAVIVAPGGAFEFLSIEHEGWNVARELAKRGFAAFVLKYRVKPTPPDQRAWTEALVRWVDEMSARNRGAQNAPSSESERAPPLEFAAATADSLAALSLVRANASRWHVDPRHVGMIGFSAGAAATLNAVTSAKPGQGPDFFGLIYGPLGRVDIPQKPPPLFAALAIDDPLFSDVSLVKAWHQAGGRAELHLYQTGGHGFGLGRPGTTNALLIEEFTTWISMQGFAAAGREAHLPANRQ